MAEAYIAIGSNIDPRENIVRAVTLLAQSHALTGLSQFYATMPTRGSGPNFINGMARIAWPGRAEELKHQVLGPLEQRLGRIRTQDKHAPRTIDLDLVVFGDCVAHGPTLVLPDPALLERDFLYVPLLEIAPDLLLPGTREKIADLAKGENSYIICPDKETNSALKESVQWKK